MTKYTTQIIGRELYPLARELVNYGFSVKCSKFRQLHPDMLEDTDTKTDTTFLLKPMALNNFAVMKFLPNWPPWGTLCSARDPGGEGPPSGSPPPL